MPLIGWFYDPEAPHDGEWVIFGAGALGISAHAQIARSGGTVISYIDNSPDKQGKALLGSPIAPTQMLPSLLAPGVNLVIASAQYASIAQQLQTFLIDRLWIGLTEAPLEIPEKLGLDSQEKVKAKTLVCLPDEALTQAVFDNALADLQRTLGIPLAELCFAAPAGRENAYVDLGLPSNLPTLEIDRDSRRFHSLVFFRDAYHPDQWNWSPYGLSLFNPRIYVLQPWGQLRCTNRIVTEHEHGQLGKHVFFRNTAYDNQSFLAFAPHIQLARDESFGPADTFGFRHPTLSRTDAESTTTINVCLFGGSAAWGQGLPDHQTLANQLQAALDNLPKPSHAKQFRVYNFAQPAATVTSEIIAFLLYGTAVKPHVVIAHDAFNDLYYGQQNDRNILRLARYAYHPMLEQWSAILHGAPSTKQDTAIPPSPQQIVGAYAFRRDQFAQITNAFGCRHINGLQPYIDSRTGCGGLREKAYRHSPLYGTPENKKMRRLYDQLKKISTKVVTVDFDEIFQQLPDAQDYFFDIVHPTAEGNNCMAQCYSQLILEMTADFHGQSQ